MNDFMTNIHDREIEDRFYAGEKFSIPSCVSIGELVYLVYGGGSLLYVGITNNFLQRIGKHLEDRQWNLDDVSFRVISVDSRTEAMELEKKLIKRYKPTENIAHNSAQHAIRIYSKRK